MVTGAADIAIMFAGRTVWYWEERREKRLENLALHENSNL
jgi:hypothetical protein